MEKKRKITLCSIKPVSWKKKVERLTVFILLVHDMTVKLLLL